MFELIPTSGLGNKMRTIDSAVSFCNTYNIPLKIYWKRDEKLINCQFKDLFLPIQNVDFYEVDKLPLKCRKANSKNFYLPIFLRKLPNTGKILNRWEIKEFINEGGNIKKLYDQHQHLVFMSFSRFHYPEKMYEIFKPTPQVQDMIKKEAQNFNEFTIGVHIRRTDHWRTIKNSPLKAFEKRIDAEIAKDRRANFYVASDCSDTKNYLVKKYGNCISTNFKPGDRTTLKGMHRGITELYALSKTTKVYGSLGSSYSRIACDLSDIELNFVK